jgi:hypothetical protein
MFGAECCQVEFYVACQLCGGVECIVPYVEIWYKNLTYKNARKQNVQKVEPKKKKKTSTDPMEDIYLFLFQGVKKIWRKVARHRN